jgi:hypothetical protein
MVRFEHPVLLAASIAPMRSADFTIRSCRFSNAQSAFGTASRSRSAAVRFADRAAICTRLRDLGESRFRFLFAAMRSTSGAN